MVYLINSYDIHDPETFKNYPPVVAKIFKKYGAKVLAMETNPKTLEGKPKTMNAIIEFPSEEAIMEMYSDPEYKAVIHHRHNSTSDTRMVILKPFEGVNKLTAFGFGHLQFLLRKKGLKRFFTFYCRLVFMLQFLKTSSLLVFFFNLSNYFLHPINRCIVSLCNFISKT